MCWRGAWALWQALYNAARVLQRHLSLTYASTLPPIDCSTQKLNATDHTAVEIRGESALMSDIDWAHRYTELPGPGWERPEFASEDLAARFVPIEQYTCANLSRDNDWELQYVSPEPTSDESRGLKWTGEAAAIDPRAFWKRRMQKALQICLL